MEAAGPVAASEYTSLCESSSAQRPRVFDACSGIGMFSFGLRNMCTVVGMCEPDPFMGTVLRKRAADGFFPSVRTDAFWSALDGLTGQGIQSVAGEIDIVSVSLSRQPIDRVGATFDSVARIASDVCAQYVLVESTCEIVEAAHRDVLHGMLRWFHANGFDCRWMCFSGEYLGAPHRRRRWWCVARRVRGSCSVVGADRLRRLQHWHSLWDEGSRSIRKEEWTNPYARPRSAPTVGAKRRKCASVGTAPAPSRVRIGSPQLTRFMSAWPESGMVENGFLYRSTHNTPDPQLLASSVRDIVLRECTAAGTSKTTRVHRWLTPGLDRSGRGGGGSALATTSKRRAQSMVNLHNQVMHALPGANDPPPMDTKGAAGSLNPEWVECLMSIPPGWTDPSSRVLLVGRLERTEYGVPATFNGLTKIRNTVDTASVSPRTKVTIDSRNRILETDLMPIVLRHALCVLLSNYAAVAAAL